jgi:plastocyanin
VKRRRTAATTQLSWEGWLAAALVLATAACDGRPRDPVPPRAVPGATLASIPVDPAATGTIRGTVRVATAPPPPAPEAMGGVHECASMHAAPPASRAVLVRDGLVEAAFVHVTAGLERYAFPAPAEGVEIDQVGCLFAPRITAVRVGQSLTLRNSDPLLHNVQAVTEVNKRLNVALPRPGATSVTTFRTPETAIRLRCDVHPWMRGFVHVMAHPCFALTSADGAYEIRGVPAGEVELTAWHEVLGTLSRRVTVRPGEVASVSFTYGEPPSG